LLLAQHCNTASPVGIAIAMTTVAMCLKITFPDFG
jgi:hypothetical protein